MSETVAHDLPLCRARSPQDGAGNAEVNPVFLDTPLGTCPHPSRNSG